MIALAPFIDIKSFDDFKGFISLVEKRNEELEAEEAETELFYSMGFSTELTDEDIEETKKDNTTVSVTTYKTEKDWQEIVTDIKRIDNERNEQKNDRK